MRFFEKIACLSCTKNKKNIKDYADLPDFFNPFNLRKTVLKKRTAKARRAQSFRGYQRKIFAFSAGYQPLSAVKITFFQWTLSNL